MSKQTTAPFRIGDKVVAIRTLDGPNGLRIEEGTIYTVNQLSQCNCGTWRVDVGFKSQYDNDFCKNCCTQMFGPVKVSSRFLRLVERRRITRTTSIEIGVAYETVAEQLDVKPVKPVKETI